MTGFAAVNRELPQGALHLEVRAVNHRYLEVAFRMDEVFRPAESAMREALAKQLNRGKVECRLNFTPSAGSHKPLAINDTLAQQLIQLGQAVQERSPNSAPLSVADILRWPGIMEAEGVPQEALQEAAVALLQQALGELAASRGREGEKLKAMILERVAQMEALVTEAAPHLPRLRAAYQEKLLARFREAAASLDEDRIRQELALFAQKIDIDEEISRLQAHLQEVRRILNQGGTAGKRLDFMMQELNREANTLGSKSIATETSRLSMELKVLIEQMREQIQNIE
ncbi:MAG: YicC/YloC family endoribonuclease [Sulfurimicrobium sp.]